VRFIAQRILLPTLAFLVLATAAAAQAPATSSTDDGFWARWFKRSDHSKSEQPHWITPLATTTPRLEQEFRSDLLWSQAKPGAAYTENYGNTKGLELIPLENFEVILGIPGYVVHNSPTVLNGWGDFQWLVKYRILSANEEHGNYILTAFLSSSIPSATNGNGNLKAIITPTLAYGKGWGDFDLQGTFGATEPAGLTSTIGRTYVWNNAFQLHVDQKLWPELEFNETWFSGGKNDGKEQLFVTPGFVAGRLPFIDRVGLTVGAGVQIAVTQFHTSDHNIIFSLRLPF
jgi:hypothetical protein